MLDAMARMGGPEDPKDPFEVGTTYVTPEGIDWVVSKVTGQNIGDRYIHFKFGPDVNQSVSGLEKAFEEDIRKGKLRLKQ